MSVLIDNSITIYEALEHIKDGKYVMPAFQRQYVWNMEQIEKLWDSILLDYPIATFLFWHVDDDKAVMPDVLAHRLMLSPKGKSAFENEREALENIALTVKSPDAIEK